MIIEINVKRNHNSEDTEQANKRKAVQNDLLSKIDKENLIRDIVTEDIQKKRVKVEEFDGMVKKQEIVMYKLREELAGLGQLETTQVKKFKSIEKELEQDENNLLIFKKNWKGKLEKQKRTLDMIRERNENMLKESEQMTTIIYEQKIRLEELKDNEEQHKLVREQKKLEYQSQLEMMVLEHEVLEKELAYTKMKADLKAQALKPAGKKLPPMAHDSSADLYDEETRPSMASKRVGAVGSSGLVNYS